ncbi:MAG: hypothetical protein JSV45_13565 [Chromatiales bacterium]|nr:MAG: hypothetical protein JSV45_13565 [Chromatiales bacterium]
MAGATTVWDESVDGDLSTDPNAPTPVQFQAGSNIITGTMGGPGNVGDYITFTFGPGQGLTGLVLLEFASQMGDERGFHGINEGPTSFIPSPATQDNFLGGNHLNAFEAGTDVLPGLATTPLVGAGFAIPLGEGTYSYLIQQTASDPTSYSLEFQVVPVPAAVWLFGSALGLLGWLRRVSGR